MDAHLLEVLENVKVKLSLLVRVAHLLDRIPGNQVLGHFRPELRGHSARPANTLGRDSGLAQLVRGSASGIGVEAAVVSLQSDATGSRRNVNHSPVGFGIVVNRPAPAARASLRVVLGNVNLRVGVAGYAIRSPVPVPVSVAALTKARNRAAGIIVGIFSVSPRNNRGDAALYLLAMLCIILMWLTYHGQCGGGHGDARAR